MFVRYSQRLLLGVSFSLLMSFALISETTYAVEIRKESAEEKFQRDVESLFGASIKTRHGEMKLRQRRDQAGRVRKQIIAGPGFSEIQLDNDGDGTVDFWEVSRGSKTVTASQPNRGRFLRLEVTDKFSKGVQKATYLLDLNGRSYSLLKTEFTGSEVRYRVEGFSASDDPAPSTLAASTVPSAGTMDRSRVELASDEEIKWAEFQTTTLGSTILCEAPDSAMNRLAALQRDWWKVLKYDADDKTENLIEQLKKSSMFDSSCRTSANAEDFNAMVKGLANVMLSSSKGQPLNSDKTRGRHLRCLEQSGLGVTAARMERAFLNGVSSAAQKRDAPIKCDWQKGSAGLSVPAETSYYYEQVTMRMCTDQDGKGKNQDGAANNYQNVLFHEFMHIAGVEDEGIVHAAQACCGDPSDNRVAACTKLDGLVYKERRYAEIETHLSRVSGDVLPMVASLERMMGRDDANKIYKEFLLRLDQFKRGTGSGQFENGLLSDVEFNKCVASSSAAACEAKWQANIEEFAKKFFKEDCVKIASGANRANCRVIAKDTSGISAGAAVIARSLVDNPNRNTASASGGETTGNGAGGGTSGGVVTPSVPAACVPVGVKTDLLKGESAWYSPAVKSFASLIFGRDVSAQQTPGCGPEVGVPTETPGNTGSVAGSTGSTNTNEAPPAVIAPVTGDIGAKSPGLVTGNTSVGVPVNTETSVGSAQSGSSRVPSRSSLAVSPVESDRSRSTLESRYRRATDFVSNASSGLGKVRDAILPAAVAGAKPSTSSSKVSARLGPRDSFVAYTADRSEKIAVNKIDNPFAIQRSIASVGNVPAPASGSAGASSIQAGALTAGGTTAKASGDAGAASGKEGPAGASVQKSRTVTVSGGLAGLSGGRDPAASSKADDKSRENKDVLGDLLSRPYRQIEARLKRLEVIEALVERRISVQDASGRILGSTRPIDRYVYAGAEKPLKRMKDHE